MELGYRGLFGEKLLVSADVYFSHSRPFIGPLQMVTPVVTVPGLAADLTRDLATGIAGNALLSAALELFNMTPEQAAALFTELLGSELPLDGLPVALVQPRENNPGVGQAPEMLLLFPNFGVLSLWGGEFGVRYYPSNTLSVFANLTWVADNFFDNEQLGEELESNQLALNAPTMKFKAGGTYRHPSGFSASVSGRASRGFPMISGVYVGDVDPHFVLDGSVAYEFGFGGSSLRADLSVTNVLDSNHREFIGAPRLGRLISGRLLYTADWNR